MAVAAPIRRFKFVSPGYFRTVGTPIVAGRDLAWTDIFDDRRVAVVSENMAREMWGQPSAALGKRIRVGVIDRGVRSSASRAMSTTTACMSPPRRSSTGR